METPTSAPNRRDRRGRGMRGPGGPPPRDRRHARAADPARALRRAGARHRHRASTSAGRTGSAWSSTPSRTRRRSPTTGTPARCRCRRWCAGTGATPTRLVRVPPADRAPLRDPRRPRGDGAHRRGRAGGRAARHRRRGGRPPLPGPPTITTRAGPGRTSATSPLRRRSVQRQHRVTVSGRPPPRRRPTGAVGWTTVDQYRACGSEHRGPSPRSAPTSTRCSATSSCRPRRGRRPCTVPPHWSAPAEHHACRRSRDAPSAVVGQRSRRRAIGSGRHRRRAATVAVTGADDATSSPERIARDCLAAQQRGQRDPGDALRRDDDVLAPSGGEDRPRSPPGCSPGPRPRPGWDHRVRAARRRRREAEQQVGRRGRRLGGQAVGRRAAGAELVVGVPHSGGDPAAGGRTWSGELVAARQLLGEVESARPRGRAPARRAARARRSGPERP